MTLDTRTMTVRRSQERGHFDHGWLNTYHTFSFADYYQPKFMGFRSLRVINEDRVQAGSGFPRHPHRDMEILSYVIDGGLQHQDSMGNGSIIRPDEIQRMTAGRGVTHSEANASQTDPVHFLQIWIEPAADRLTPGYEQKAFARTPGLTLLASPDGADGSITVHQDVRLYRLILEPGQSATAEFGLNRFGYIQVVRGQVSTTGEDLRAGDGAALKNPGRLDFVSHEGVELLLFDLN